MKLWFPVSELGPNQKCYKSDPVRRLYKINQTTNVQVPAYYSDDDDDDDVDPGDDDDDDDYDEADS